MDAKIQQQYRRWREQTAAEEDLQAELEALCNDEAGLEDAFYRDLAFGTGGLRGVLGAGTNRMNVYTVAKASQGLADYVKTRFTAPARRIAISYDSRLKSEQFARTAAGVFAANGIQVYLYSKLMPTPCLSFAVRELRCAAGVMITASHNPAQYNGYKVYGADGCQITTQAADEILAEIQKLDVFADVRSVPFDAAVREGQIQYIPEAVYTAFVEAVKGQSVLGDVPVRKDAAIVYTPLNGAGLEPVLRTLRESGYSNITVVREQEQPDGRFPTCPYPNPEVREAMALGIEYAKQRRADLLLATDPDCDRVGIAVRDKVGEYVLLSGNETGLLLLDYLCARRTALGTMPKNPVLVKTIVTTDLAERVAAHYGVRTVNVLTGFKFIGEQIGLLEAAGRADSYLFGFEESYGCLSGTYVRDKDAVNGAFLICEMFAYYAAQGVGLLEKLEELYRTYGYCLNTLHSYSFQGAAGAARMQELMQALRAAPERIGPKRVVRCLDYAQGLDGLPKSDVLKFILEGDCSVVVRPSGTEPKLKLYASVCAPGRAEAAALEAELTASFAQLFQ